VIVVDDGPKPDDELEKILRIEDEIIVKFCEFNGGMEFAMPIIRKQFEKLNIDFKRPTKEDLHIIVDHLISVTHNIKGDDVAKEEKRCFKELLSKLDSI
jgi:hypothetical protein